MITAMHMQVRVTNRVKELRTARGLTLQAVATGCGTYPMTIQRIEQHRRGVSDSMRLRLARFFGVTVNELFTVEEMISPEDMTSAAQPGAPAPVLAGAA